ncbi:GNAT family N-acetyltransferase [Erythrobacter sp. THAF29]|uniref:GNAT family N-acetyltransferase n=1 Tax=Erythrobacter sp. THAF29 TaxID=2587851 RepID=UPI001267EBBA|nr:GNAT family N-acetyltransferase [Erythrobacter sp. THAF29]
MKHDRQIETLTAPSSRVAETLALAFRDDPALSWIQPDPEARRRMLPRFFAIAAEQSQHYGGVLASKSRTAAALLYPPGQVREGGLWVSLRLLAIFKTALSRGLKVAEAMHKEHPRPQPYLYLRYVGVAPEAQGQGLGGAIIRDIIARAAMQRRGVLLETATQSNVAIYTRLGFDIVSEWEVPGGGPKFWTMIHPAP